MGILYKYLIIYKMPAGKLQIQQVIGTVYRLHHKTKNLKPYYGSTNNLKKRTKAHAKRCIPSSEKNHNYNVYKYIRAHGGFDEWQMTPILTSGAYMSIEALFIKRTWDRNLNRMQPKRTRSEHYQANKVQICAYQNTQVECHYCGKSVSRRNLSRHRNSGNCS